MKTVLFVLLLAGTALALKNVRSPPLDESRPAIDNKMIEHVNSQRHLGWKAGKNLYFEGKTLAQVKGLLGAKKGGPKLPAKRFAAPASLPTNFDARQQWPECASIQEVRDQGSCGSCWAFGAVEAMSDRICVATNQQKQVHLSAEDLVSCCGFSCGDGCNGGYLSAAWQYAQSSGIVTGANYGVQPTLCSPYTIANCSHHVNGPLPPCGAIQPTPQCTQQCVDGEQWGQAKHYMSSTYSLNSVQDAMTDIYQHGSIEAAFDVYEDFLTYKSGVYTHTTGSYLGGHAIKILGWGVENGQAYWLVANSWNDTWGDKGFFKIARGTDECGIEDQLTSGLPAV